MKQLPTSRLSDDFECGAEFSECRTYRYVLWRRWGWQGYAKQVMFIGLNPSTADETEDDQTVRRCVRFAKDWNYSGLLMVNAFAFCATDPGEMKKAGDPIGPENDEVIAYRAAQAGLIVAAWGAHCSTERELEVCHTIGKTIHCLGRTKAGRPRHPLRLRADTTPERFWSPGTGYCAMRVQLDRVSTDP